MATPQLPISRGIGPTVQQAPLPVPAPVVEPQVPEEVYQPDPVDDMIAQHVARMNARVHKPMYTPEQVQQRQDQNDLEYKLGILGQLSNRPGLSEVGGTILKHSLAQSKPVITERGMTNPVTGEFTYDPDYLDKEDQAKLLALQQFKITGAEKRQEHERQRIFQETMLGLKTDAAIKIKAAPKAGGAGSGLEKADHYGWDAQNGQRIDMTKTGIMVVPGLDASGQPTQVPYTGTAPVPKAVAEKAIGDAQTAQGTGDNIDRLMAQVEKNPAALGTLANASSHFGPLAPQAAKVFQVSPETMALRAKIIRQAAMETHTLYGAALSQGEEKRANGFLVDASNDTFESAMAKLQAAREYAKELEMRGGATWAKIARTRSGNKPVAATLGNPGDKAPAAAASGLTPDEEAELATLKGAR